MRQLTTNQTKVMVYTKSTSWNILTVGSRHPSSDIRVPEAIKFKYFPRKECKALSYTVVTIFNNIPFHSVLSPGSYAPSLALSFLVIMRCTLMCLVLLCRSTSHLVVAKLSHFSGPLYLSSSMLLALVTMSYLHSKECVWTMMSSHPGVLGLWFQVVRVRRCWRSLSLAMGVVHRLDRFALVGSVSIYLASSAVLYITTWVTHKG